jgi:hypothetical protein
MDDSGGTELREIRSIMLTEQPNNNPGDKLKIWNPFLPTKRDIARTDELASKNAVLTGILSYFFVPAGLLYLNRGANTLKIFGYIFAISFMFGLVARSEEDPKTFRNLLSLFGAGAIATEQVMAVNKARQRLQTKSPLEFAYSSDKNEKALPSIEPNKEAVKGLKQLKEKYEAQEITEEEFKIQKQQILESL